MRERYMLLMPIFLVAFILLLLELALEYRHYRLGWNTPIFGISTPKVKSEKKRELSTTSEYGPVIDFPFRSKVLSQDKGGNLRLWVASASHAEHSRLPPEQIFPNLICQFVISAKGQCEVINGSKAGIGISDNLKYLEDYANKYRPDYVLLYQSSQVIAGQQKQIQKQIEGAKKEAATGQSNSIFNFSKLKDLFQRTSAYQHLSDYVGGNIKLQSNLKNNLPIEFHVSYENMIKSFIDETRLHGSEPILITFSASHSAENIDQLPRNLETNFVRYSVYLSAVGWVNTIEHYNNRLRAIAKQEGVLLFDLEEVLHGRSEYFVDYVHFSSDGHKVVAKFIGNEIDSLLTEN